ncbi:MAG: 2-C-methyl-D-erythritol 4-phosphate cytidylyltransferase [Muribaculaceae bacterium]|nr:2-C-methyl-D-erythritol 4-phosphate cytidylyltransferase [Muribaculaceae bacterium]
MPSVEIIIVAAGSGLRYGAPLPKQFCELAGRPVVMHTVDRLRHIMPDANITLVISRDMSDLWSDLCSKHSFASPEIAFGGATRWESVRNAIAAGSPEADIIMVHDAVRPLVTSEMIDSIKQAMSDSDVDGAIPAVPVTDSLRVVGADGSSVSIDRSPMRAVQTPQAFKAMLLRKAYSMPYQDSFTDDASVMESAGFGNLKLTKGSPSNIKITNPGDIAVAELLMKQNELSSQL